MNKAKSGRPILLPLVATFIVVLLGGWLFADIFDLGDLGWVAAFVLFTFASFLILRKKGFFKRKSPKERQ